MNDHRPNPSPDPIEAGITALLSADVPAGPSPMLSQRTLAAIWAAEAKTERAAGFRTRIAAAILLGTAGIAIAVALFHRTPAEPSRPSLAIIPPSTRAANPIPVSSTQPTIAQTIIASADPIIPAAPLGEVAVTGHVLFEGPAPTPHVIDVSAYPGVSGSVPGPIVDDSLVVNSDRTLANVIVYISGPVPATDPIDPPPILIQQKYCMIEPHVVAAMIGQRLILEDYDSFPHAIHSINCATTPTFNTPVMTRARRVIDPFAAVDTFQIGCEIHPWMRGWVRVFEHPYFDVTRSAGTFLIKNLPAGTYQLHAWHELLGDQEKTITVNGGEPLSVDFSFASLQP